MYVDVHCPPMLRSLVSSRVEWNLKKTKDVVICVLLMRVFVCV
jgi:hypothetical protein